VRLVLQLPKHDDEHDCENSVLVQTLFIKSFQVADGTEKLRVDCFTAKKWESGQILKHYHTQKFPRWQDNFFQLERLFIQIDISIEVV
jgi:hypothetical protein